MWTSLENRVNPLGTGFAPIGAVEQQASPLGGAFGCDERKHVLVVVQLVAHFPHNGIARCRAVKSQIWIAICVYLIVIIAKKRLNLPASPHLLLNIIDVNMFEKTPIEQLVTDALLNSDDYPVDNQMLLF